ncbi:MAG: glycosyltransferase family 4 protein [Bacteroidales bacterium]|nr:glycosyltransferase family 4 protein [Bacteroidales bacterium]MCF8386543.1 glycosyltransferase family 4 protein [Bacteroidales bacterium]MCF8398606.1 glycosyltransferase family 4 protein [Bacteroidales bacterium]
MKKILINAEPLDRQKAGIHYYISFLRQAFQTYFPDYPVYYLREDQQDLLPRDVYMPSKESFRRDPLKHFIRIPRYVARHQPDVYVELTHFGPFNLPSCTRRISIIHDLTPLKFPEHHPFFSAFFQRFFIRHSVRHADVVVANSKNTRDDIIAFYPEVSEKTIYIYPAIEAGFSKKQDLAVLRKYNIHKKYIISLSTLEPRKNMKTLLAAFAQFKEQKNTEHLLVLAGKGGWKNKGFLRMLEKHPYRKDIVLTGYVERASLPALYSGAESFVFPSYYEGFGFPVLEALSCETPCIVSEVSSLPEVGGNAVLYFNPDSVTDLAAKIERLLSDDALREKLRKESLMQARKFNLQKFGQDFINIFENADKKKS